MKRLSIFLMFLVWASYVFAQQQYFDGPLPAYERQNDSSYWIVPADFNADGTMDIYIGQSRGLNSKVFYLGPDLNAYKATYIGDAGDILPDVDDLNGDGLMDIAYIGNNGSDLNVAIQAQDGGFTVNFVVSGLDAYQIAIEDMNADGSNDILVRTDSMILFFPGDGSGNFSSHDTIVDSLGHLTGFAVYDFNGDNTPDIVVGASDSGMIYLCQMAATETGVYLDSLKEIAPAGNATFITVDDLNNDKYPDILCFTNDTLLWVENLADTATAGHVIATGLSYQSGLTVGMFNDSIVDLVTTTYGDPGSGVKATVVQWVNDGNMNFLPDTLIEGDSRFASPSVLDFDNDGYDDIVFNVMTTFSSPSWFYLKSDGKGKFAPESFMNQPYESIAGQDSMTVYLSDYGGIQVYSFPLIYMEDTIQTFPEGFTFVDTADFNGDGEADLLFINQVAGEVAISYGQNYKYSALDSIGSFTANNLSDIVIGDFNKDGKIDIAASVYGTGIVLYQNNGGSFTQSSKSTMAGHLASGTFLSDTMTLIVYNTADSKLYYSDPGWNFTQIDQLGGIAGLRPANLNTDKYMDFVAYNTDTIFEYVYDSTAANFYVVKKLILPADKISKIYALDYENDGDDDLAVLYHQDTYYYVSLFLNMDGQGEMSKEQMLYQNSDFMFYDISINDYNLDGLMDIVLSEKSDQISYLKNAAKSEAFRAEPVSDATGRYALVEDINNDGKLDIILSNSDKSEIDYLLNTGNGNFDTKFLTGLSNPYGLIYADMDGDGTKDVVAGSIGLDSMYMVKLAAGQVVSSQWSLFGMVYPTIFDFGDIDGDGDVDLVVGSQATDQIVWYPNDGSAGATASLNSISTTADSVQCVRVADIDGDGDLDVVSASANDNKVSWYPNDAGSFQTENTISTTSKGAKYIILADMNGDSYIDVVSVSQLDSTVEVFYNDGTGSFTNSILVTDSAVNVNSADVADVDGDGLPDVYVATPYSIVIYKNDSSFFEYYRDVTQNAQNSKFIRAFDYDGDGDFDVLSLEDSNVVIYKMLHPKFTEQPQNDTAITKTTASFTVKADEAGWYHWYAIENDEPRPLFDDDYYQGANSETLEIKNVDFTMNGYKYFAYAGAGQDSVSSDTAVLVVDTLPPHLVLFDTVYVYLDNSGKGFIDSSMVIDTLEDNGKVVSYDIDPDTVDCGSVGEDFYTYVSAQDLLQNKVLDSAWVVVADTVSPSFTTKDLTVYLNYDGFATIDKDSVVINVSDNCYVQDTTIEQDTFTCENLGQNVVSVTVTDIYGNAKTLTFQVQVNDTISPTLSTVDDTLYLDINGNAVLTADQVVAQAADSCGLQDTTLDKTNFSTADLGENQVKVTVTDLSGNSTSLLTTVYVKDTISPVITGDTMIVYLDASGTGKINWSGISISDNCNLMDTVVSRESFNCADVPDTTVTVTVQDSSSNETSKTIIVKVLDTLKPVIYAHNDTIYLDQYGSATLAYEDVLDSLVDNCSIQDTSLSKTTFDCQNVGDNLVTITATDVNGNTATKDITVTVVDSLAPFINGASQVANDTIYVDENGVATVTLEKLGVTVSDNCGVQDTTISNTTFSCDAVKSSTVGAQSVNITVTDIHGNSSTETDAFYVLDTIKPKITGDTMIVYLDNTGSAKPNWDNIAVSDNCELMDTTLSKSDFYCSDVPYTTTSITVRDSSSNEFTKTVTVIVKDTMAPLLTTRNITVYLDTAGQAKITAFDLISSVSDNCSLKDTTISQTIFDCQDVGSNTITVTATDSSDNTVSKTATVTVLDTISPLVSVGITKAYLDTSGQFVLTYDNLDLSVNENCSVQDTTLSKTVFYCGDLGLVYDTVTVTDVNGNTRKTAFTFDLVDTIKPKNFTKNMTVYLDNSGSAKFDKSQLNLWDNCSIVDTAVSQDYFSCEQIPSTNVLVVLQDNAGNYDSTYVTVNVNDTIAPVIYAHDVTLYLDSNGTAVLPAYWAIDSIVENCKIQDTTLSKSTFTCSDLGIDTVTITVTDAGGNSVSKDITVLIKDNIYPSVTTKTDTIYLDASGNATLTKDRIIASTWDNCSVQDTILSKTAFTCSDLGMNAVTVTVVDEAGDSTSVTANVYVSDTIKPVITGTVPDVYIGATGGVNIDYSGLTVSDNCPVSDSIYYDKVMAYCQDIPQDTLWVSVSDNAGNTVEAQYIINVYDTVKPVLITQNATLYLDENGQGVLDPYMIILQADDNCAMSDTTISKTTFDCQNIGDNSVTVTATDKSGNTSSAVVTVTVVDSAAPKIECPEDLFLYLTTEDYYIVDSNRLDAKATDNCSLGTVYNTLNNTTTLNGDTLYPGFYEIDWIATDAAGNEAKCKVYADIYKEVDTVGLGTLSMVYNQSYEDYHHFTFYAILQGSSKPVYYTWYLGEDTVQTSVDTIDYTFASEDTCYDVYVTVYLDNGKVLTSNVQNVCIYNPFSGVENECIASINYSQMRARMFRFTPELYLSNPAYYPVMAVWYFDSAQVVVTDTVMKSIVYEFKETGEQYVELDIYSVDSATGDTCMATAYMTVWAGEEVWYSDTCQALFRYTVDSSNYTLVYFEDISYPGDSSQITYYNWDFGDSSYSNLANPVHQFDSAGQHNIGLKIVTSSGCHDRFNMQIYLARDVEVVLFYPDTLGYKAGKGYGVKFYNLSKKKSDKWTWDFGEEVKGSILKTSLDTVVHYYQDTGTYVVTLTDQLSGLSFSMNVHVLGDRVDADSGQIFISTATGEVQVAVVKLKYYPNPVTDELNVVLDQPAKKVNVTIYDYQGRKLMIKNYANQKQLKVQLSDLAKGAYLMRIIYDDKVTVLKFTKI